MRLDPDEQVANVRVRIYVMKPTRRDDRVKHRKVLRVLSTAGKERPLSAERYDAQHSLCRVVVESKFRIVQKPLEMPDQSAKPG